MNDSLKSRLRPVRPMYRLVQSVRTAVLRKPSRLFYLHKELAWYVASLRQYKKLITSSGSTEKLEPYPILFQRVSNMPFDAHYVYQAVWAQKRIVPLKPKQHVDVSSNIPFVAQLSSLVPLLYVEYNPPRMCLPNIRLQKANLTALPFADQSLPSLSCLHVIEHIGLGRYGDPLDPLGSQRACIELSRCVAPGGSLFISTPIGQRCTFFNAHRVHEPDDIVAFMPDLQLVEFSVVTDERRLIEDTTPDLYKNMQYACGLYWFRRHAAQRDPS